MNGENHVTFVSTGESWWISGTDFFVWAVTAESWSWEVLVGSTYVSRPPAKNKYLATERTEGLIQHVTLEHVVSPTTFRTAFFIACYVASYYVGGYYHRPTTWHERHRHLLLWHFFWVLWNQSECIHGYNCVIKYSYPSLACKDEGCCREFSPFSFRYNAVPSQPHPALDWRKAARAGCRDNFASKRTPESAELYCPSLFLKFAFSHNSRIPAIWGLEIAFYHAKRRRQRWCYVLAVLHGF